jgi:diguanylate cyclase (GGDEF)-like protein/putative nucleotidyltransferase with HDIG domain
MKRKAEKREQNISPQSAAVHTKLSVATDEMGLIAKIYWFVLMFFSAVCVAWTLYNFVSFTIIQAILLCLLSIATVAASLLVIKLPNSKGIFTGGDVVVFLSILWLGMPSSALIGGVSGLATCAQSTDNKRDRFTAFAIGVIRSFASGYACYFALPYVDVPAHPAANYLNSVNDIIIALVVISLVHYTVGNFLITTLEIFTKEESAWKIGLDNFLWASWGYVSNTFAAGVLHVGMIELGLVGGALCLPMLILPYLAYRTYFRQSEQKSNEIEETSRIHLATVEALATAIDARDQMGHGHVRRVQLYAVSLGKLLNLPDDEMKALSTGALLHDIGKLAVPDHILNKPGTLTQAEMEKIKVHASVGAAILEHVNFPYPVVKTVRHHHEYWDGTGYPDRLRGEDIPITARIIAIVDSYDTLREDRSYRAALSREEARRVLLSSTGKQLDPKLTDIFLRNLRQFEREIDEKGLSYQISPHARQEELLSSDVAPLPHHQTGDNPSNYLEQIKRANREVFSLYELARVFSGSLNVEQTLALFAEKIGDFVPFDTCLIYLYNESNGVATAVHAVGKHADFLRGKQVRLGEGATGFVLKTCQTVYMVNPMMDFSFNYAEIAQDYKGMACFPLIAKERLIGAVSLYSSELDNYEDEHMRLLETISRIAADAISKAIHYTETETHALTDPMTNLPNARALQMQFEKEASRSIRTGTPFQVIMLDLDEFKKVNDTFGHKVGDLLLKEVSKVMRHQLRDYDFLARYAGDEFVAIVPELVGEPVVELCGRIEEAVLKFQLPVGTKGIARVGISIGAASYPANGDTLDQVLIAADQSMYSVKAAHKRKHKLQTPPPTNELPVVELDESHIISSAVN